MKTTRQRGSVLIYAFCCTLLLSAIAALAVDWGRVQVVRTELQAAADAAARFAASGLDNSIYGQSAAPANAAAVIAQNNANGQAIAFNRDLDVVLGTWKNGKFKAKEAGDTPNAVRVTARCVVDRGTGVALTFLPIIGGKRMADVTASSVAVIDYSHISGGAGNGRFDYFLPATSNPWLAGLPEGTIASVNNPHKNPDYAGQEMTDDGQKKDIPQTAGLVGGGSTSAGSSLSNYAQWGEYAAKKASPIKAGGIVVDGGRAITFDGINGGANNASSSTNYTADGNTGSVVSNLVNGKNNWQTPENGIANIKAPINSIIGVFLGPDVPDVLNPPPALDFGSSSSRDFTTLMPKIAQPFFIGDGRTSTGEVQQFVPPAGATRLFVGTMDSYEWSNNQGGFYVTAHAAGRVMTVSE